MAEVREHLLRCAIYTRKSTEEGLEQSFNTLQAQREAAEAYILSHREEGWRTVPALYDDGGWSGANLERPALHALAGGCGSAPHRLRGGLQGRPAQPFAARLHTLIVACLRSVA